MMRTLARLPGMQLPDSGQSKAARRSAIVGIAMSGVVLAHLIALGAGGAYLFLRSGTGYGRGETLMLICVAVVAVLALTRSVILRRSPRASKSTNGDG